MAISFAMSKTPPVVFCGRVEIICLAIGGGLRNQNPVDAFVPCEIKTLICNRDYCLSQVWSLLEILPSIDSQKESMVEVKFFNRGWSSAATVTTMIQCPNFGCRQMAILLMVADHQFGWDEQLARLTSATGPREFSKQSDDRDGGCRFKIAEPVETQASISMHLRHSENDLASVFTRIDQDRLKDKGSVRSASLRKEATCPKLPARRIWLESVEPTVCERLYLLFPLHRFSLKRLNSQHDLAVLEDANRATWTG